MDTNSTGLTTWNHSTKFTMEQLNLTYEPAIIYNISLQGPPVPPEDVQLLQGIVRGLQLYYAPVLAIPGLLGNLLCVLAIVYQPKSSLGHVYCMALILAESLRLMALLHDWATEMGADLYRVIGWCHLVIFQQKGSEFLCQWYLVCIIVDCYISNCASPARSTRNNSSSSRTNSSSSDWSPVWRARLVTVALAVLALVVFLNISLTTQTVYIGMRPVCMADEMFLSMQFYLNRLDIAINVLIPAVLVIGFGIRLIINQTCEAQSSVSDNTEHSGYLLYGIIHSVLWLPLQVVRIANTIILIASGQEQLSLRAYLWEQVIVYIIYTNMALSVIQLMLLHSPLRHYVAQRLHVIWSALCPGCMEGDKYNGRHVVGNNNGTHHSAAIEIISPSDEEVENN